MTAGSIAGWLVARVFELFFADGGIGGLRSSFFFFYKYRAREIPGIVFKGKKGQYRRLRVSGMNCSLVY